MARNKITKTLLLCFEINTVLTIIELVGGTLSGSVALVADGFQNLSDSIILTIAYVCEKLVSRIGISKRKRINTYKAAGYMNAAILFALGIFIGLQSFERLEHPQEINGLMVLIIGIISATTNWFVAALLFKNRHKKHIAGPYVGLLFSGFSGAGVLVSGFCSYYLHIEGVDAIIGFVIAAVLLLRAIQLAGTNHID